MQNAKKLLLSVITMFFVSSSRIFNSANVANAKVEPDKVSIIRDI